MRVGISYSNLTVDVEHPNPSPDLVHDMVNRALHLFREALGILKTGEFVVEVGPDDDEPE